MGQKKEWKKPDKETTVFILFFVCMAVYYGYRMFALIPWYDELYTYYYFISRGPVYAAIHWPLPNNHVGYSVLSACLLPFGSSAFALRGVSFLCSLGSLLVLYRMGRKFFGKGLALMPVFLFAGMNLVNNLAAQGRGYALVTFCYLVSLWELLYIVVEHRGRIGNYVIFGLSLVFALWAIPSSVYVAVPVCLIGGFVLLLQKDGRGILRLVIASLISALCAFLLYALLWLAIGSNLLTKTADSGYFGLGHVSIILHHPFHALKTGAEYMLATPYIQSVERAGFFGQFREWLGTLFSAHFSYAAFGGSGRVYAALLLAGMAVLLYNVIRRFVKKDYEINYNVFLEWFLLLSFIMLPLFLIAQCKLPYYRVFSFAGATLAFLLTYLVRKAADAVVLLCGRKRAGNGENGKTENDDEKTRGKKSGGRMIKCISVGAAAVTGILCIVSVAVQSGAYSMREELVADAYEQGAIEEADVIGVTDCDQEYLLLYLYGIEGDRVTRQIEEADAVLFDKPLLGRDYDYRQNIEEWKFYLTKEETPLEYLEENMLEVYENWQFVLYKKR